MVVQFYNILKIEHTITQDSTCLCNKRSPFANVEVLYTNLTLEEVEQFRQEISKAYKMHLSKDIAMNKASAFRNIPYAHLYTLHSAYVRHALMIIQSAFQTIQNLDF